MKSPSANPSGTARETLESMRESGLVPEDDFDALPANVRGELSKIGGVDRLMVRLVEEKLLTAYQADMVRAGKMHSLILGEYRILERIGVGDMAVVFRAEHATTRREVAVKVFSPLSDQDENALMRFFAERKTLAQLRHPNIVNVLDVGEQATPDPLQPKLYYYAMEHVAGQDLEVLVKRNGPLPAARACEVACFVASALAEAHRHRLVHRNVEPANVLVTDDGKVKLLDFGLARQFSGRMTVPGTSLGSLDYMAPEQAADASGVDIRADIYGLGATLYWCLTGQAPYAFLGTKARDLSVRLTTPPKGPKTARGEVPAEVDAVVLKMMALKPEERFATPEELLRALETFAPDHSEAHELADMPAAPVPAAPAAVETTPPPAEEPAAPHVLIVDKDETVRLTCRKAAEAAGLSCDEAGSAKDAATAAAARTPAIILLADQLDQPGVAVLRKFRQEATSAYQKVIMLVGGGPNAVKQLLSAGVDDYVTKPLDADQLAARIKTASQLYQAQARADRLARQLASEKAAAAAAAKQPEKPAKTGLLGGLRRLFAKR
jgi:CheY-like chemotaxis protein